MLIMAGMAATSAAGKETGPGPVAVAEAFWFSIPFLP
jgi:hypothetical protein